MAREQRVRLATLHNLDYLVLQDKQEVMVTRAPKAQLAILLMLAEITIMLEEQVLMAHMDKMET